jgi:hypothetical protein
MAARCLSSQPDFRDLTGSTLRLIASAVLAAALLALLPAVAVAGSGGATVFTHSARSGELRAGMLTLRGVGNRVTWAHNEGRSGTVSVKRLHRRLFSPETPATGTLQIAGRRPGQELALRLSRPRYNGARHLVRYRAQRLSKRTGGVAQASQAAGPSEFGAASLSMVAHPSLLGGSGIGVDCAAGILNLTIHELRAVSAAKWDTDEWDPGSPFGATIDALGGTASWGSDAGFLRGCSNTVVWQTSTTPPVSFTITTTHPYRHDTTGKCVSSDSSFSCKQTIGIDEINWLIRPIL